MSNLGKLIMVLIAIASVRCSVGNTNTILSSTPSPIPQEWIRFENQKSDPVYIETVPVPVENCNSNTEVKVTVSRIRSTTTEIRLDVTGEIEAGLTKIISAKLAAFFSIIEGVTDSQSVGVEVLAEPRSYTIYEVTWNEIWQTGDAVIDNLNLRIPYHVRTGVQGSIRSVSPPQPCPITPSPTVISILPTLTDTPTSSPTVIIVPSATNTPTPLPTQIPTDIPPSVSMPITATPQLCTVFVTVASANVRIGPGTGYQVLGAAQNNSEFYVTGRSFNNEWWQITYNNNSAWISSQVTYDIGDCLDVPIIDVPLIEATQPPTVEREQPTSSAITQPEPTRAPTVATRVQGGNITCGSSVQGEFLQGRIGSRNDFHVYYIDLNPGDRLQVRFTPVGNDTWHELQINKPSEDVAELFYTPYHELNPGPLYIETDILGEPGTYKIWVASPARGYYTLAVNCS